jgi:hypothetical protein
VSSRRLAGFALLLPPPIVFWTWNRFADAQKAKNAIADSPAASMVSATLHAHLWNLGTWGQLFSKQLVFALVDACNDSLGNIVVPLIAALIVFVFYRDFDRETRLLYSIAFAAFCFPLLLFTNLYIQHNYYFTENAIFLIFAIAVIISRLFSTGRRALAWGLLLLTLLFQLIHFREFFAKDIANPYYNELLPIADTIRLHTDPDGVVVIYGQEWSPVIPYYSERRALMEPGWIPQRDIVTGLHKILTPIDGHRVEAIVRCRSALDNQTQYAQKFAAFDVSFRKEHVGGCDVYFTSQKR